MSLHERRYRSRFRRDDDSRSRFQPPSPPKKDDNEEQPQEDFSLERPSLSRKHIRKDVDVTRTVVRMLPFVGAAILIWYLVDTLVLK